MKIKQFFKKAAATVMAAVTVLSLLPTTAFAATGDVGTISFTRTYDSAGNAMYYNSSAVINGYTAGGTGKNKYRMYVDGSTAFCIQPGVPLKIHLKHGMLFQPVRKRLWGWHFCMAIRATVTV